MKATFPRLFWVLLACALSFSLAQERAFAQAPAGQQGGAQQQPPPPHASQQQKPQEGGVSISVEVPVVTLDVVATTQHGDLITGLKRDNFRILEDGQPQTISTFAATDAPITIVMLMEFSSRGIY